MQSITEYKKLDPDLAPLATELLKIYKQPRFKWEQEVMEMKEFAKGNHYFYKYSVYGLPINQNQYSRVVQYSTMLAENKRAQIVGNYPTIVVKPNLFAKDYDQAVNEAMFIQEELHNVWRKNNARILFADITLDAILTNSGYIKVYTDPVEGIKYKREDWYNILAYPGVWNLDDSPMVIRRFTGIIGEYKEKEGWDLKGIVPQVLYDADPLRYTEMQRIYDEPPENPIDDLNLFEAYEFESPVIVTDKIKSSLDKDYPWISDKEVGDKIMRIFTVCQEKVIYDMYADYDRFSVFCYCPQSTPIYAKSLFSRLVSSNKSYDNIISQIEMFIAFANKYRLLVEKGSEVDDIDNVSGQKLYYKGTPPQVMKQDQLSVTVFDYIQKLEQTMQMIMGLSASSLGQMASGSKKFKAMETQKQQDVFNTSPSIDRLKSFLQDITQFTLSLLAGSTEMKDVAYFDGLKPQQSILIGEAYKKHMERKNDPDKLPNEFKQAVVLSAKQDIEIKIQPGLNYTSDSMAQKVVDLIKSDPVTYPPEMLELVYEDARLDYYIKLGRKLAKRDKEQELQDQMQLQQQEQAANPQPQQQPGMQQMPGQPMQQQPQAPQPQQGQPTNYNPALLHQAMQIAAQKGLQAPATQSPMNAQELQQSLEHPKKKK